GVSTGALFMMAGALQERLHTRELDGMGGLWKSAPRMGAVALVFCLASLGLPGLGNFNGEFLVFLGVFRVSVEAAVLAASGVVLSAIYSLWVVQRVFHGAQRPAVHDFGLRETAVFASMVAVIVWLGLFPQPVLDLFGQTIKALTVSPPLPLDAEAGGQGHFGEHAVYFINLATGSSR
ncbi:partial NADH-quinone oxidoreductase subunit M, partial [Anaerolineae bacterium]